MTMAAAATTTTFLAAILSRRGSGENFIHDDLAAADPISSKTTDQFKIIGAIKMNFITKYRETYFFSIEIINVYLTNSF